MILKRDSLDSPQNVRGGIEESIVFAALDIHFHEIDGIERALAENLFERFRRHRSASRCFVRQHAAHLCRNFRRVHHDGTRLSSQCAVDDYRASLRWVSNRLRSRSKVEGNGSIAITRAAGAVASAYNEKLPMLAPASTITVSLCFTA